MTNHKYVCWRQTAVTSSGAALCCQSMQIKVYSITHTYILLKLRSKKACSKYESIAKVIKIHIMNFSSRMENFSRLAECCIIQKIEWRTSQCTKLMILKKYVISALCSATFRNVKLFWDTNIYKLENTWGLH